MNKSKVVFRHDLYLALWNWLAENPEKDREEWPGWKGLRKPKYQNFACDAAHKMGIAMLGREHPNKCLICPLHFVGGNCLRPRSWQHEWYECKGNNEARRTLALMMRDTPLSEGWDGIVQEAVHE